jgi:hypothetical protein
MSIAVRKAQADALRGVLAEIGFADALLARETDRGLMLIDGHLRAETAPDQDAPVLMLDVDAAEADKLLATLDPLASLAEMDTTALKSLMDSVKWSSAELAKTLQPLWPGRGPAVNLREPPAQIDKAAELQAKWGTQPGQLWQIGLNRMLCADCREKACTLPGRPFLTAYDPNIFNAYHILNFTLDINTLTCHTTQDLRVVGGAISHLGLHLVTLRIREKEPVQCLISERCSRRLI